MVSLRSLVDIQMKCQRNKQYINLRCRNEGQTKDLFENHQPTDFFFFLKHGTGGNFQGSDHSLRRGKNQELRLSTTQCLQSGVIIKAREGTKTK